MTGIHRAAWKHLGSSSHGLLDPGWYLHCLVVWELGNAAVQRVMTTVTTTLLLSMLLFIEITSRVLTRTYCPQLTAFKAAQDQAAYSTNLYTNPYQSFIVQIILEVV